MPFLYHMVRRMVYLQVLIGKNLLELKVLLRRCERLNRSPLDWPRRAGWL